LEKKESNQTATPFPVAAYRFDQKNEMFKRNFWDEEKKADAARFYTDIKYLNKPGYTKTDVAVRNAAWSMEHGFGFGNSQSNSGLYSWEGVPDKIKLYVETGEPVRETPDKMSHVIKRAAHFFGADLTGICRLHPNWVYSHEFNLINLEHYPIEVPKGCENAVVMAVEMDYDTLRTSPGSLASAATGAGYSKMAVVARQMAIFIRSLGYRAIPCGNDTALSIPLAMAAGLGECSRMGLVVTEKFGPRIRICKVFTDMPLQYDSYHQFGVEEFCKTCKKCATHCPSRAISMEDMTEEGPSSCNQHGLLKWYIDPEKCYSFWSRNRMDCTTCVGVCPFNQKNGKMHDLVRAAIKRTTLFNRFFVWMDGITGHDKAFSSERFWGS